MKKYNRFTTFVSEWAQVIGLGLLMLAIVVLCFIMFSAVLTLFAVIIGVAACFWAIGYPITVTSGGEKVGYIRWFTFHRL